MATWTCPRCKETVEESFDVCWACGTARDGTVDPSFQRQEDDTQEGGAEANVPTDASAAAEVVPPPVVDPLVPPPEVADLDPVTLAPPRPEMPAVPFAPGPSASRSCPDCGGALAPIRLLDQTGRGSAHANLEYAGVGSQPGFWSGRFPVAGVVRAWMCRECGRIVLYGEPAPEV